MIAEEHPEKAAGAARFKGSLYKEAAAPSSERGEVKPTRSPVAFINPPRYSRQSKFAASSGLPWPL